MNNPNNRTAAFARRTTLLATLAVFYPIGGHAGAALPEHIFNFAQTLFQTGPIADATSGAVQRYNPAPAMAAIQDDFAAGARAVPPPAGLAILGLGLAALGALQRRETATHATRAA